jgi:hypothetical protein
MLELDQFSHACRSGRSALYRATLSLPSLLLWLAAILSALLPAPCASARAPWQGDIIHLAPGKAPEILPRPLALSRAVSLTQQEN